MPWLQLTEMVPDQEEQDKRDAAAVKKQEEEREAAAADESGTTSKSTTSKTSKTTTAEVEGPVPLVEQVRLVKIPHEARVQFPTLGGLDVGVFGSNALTKVEFFTDEDKPDEGDPVPSQILGDSSGVIGVIGNDYEDEKVKEAVGAAAASGGSSSSKSSSSS